MAGVKGEVAPRIYVPVRIKFAVALVVAVGWTVFSVWMAQQWMSDLTSRVGVVAAALLVGGIAIVPGFMNAFLIASLAMDRRPPRRPLDDYPPLTILIAAYNEEASILDTLASIERQNYPAPLQVIVINDGSRDATASLVRGAEVKYPWLRLLDMPRNGGKAKALNAGLKLALNELVVTVDADSYLQKLALVSIVERYRQDPPNTRAVTRARWSRRARSRSTTARRCWRWVAGTTASANAGLRFRHRAGAVRLLLDRGADDAGGADERADVYDRTAYVRPARPQGQGATASACAST